MVGFMYLCIYLFITVPTTCSRPSIEMVGFIYVCMYLLPCRLLVVGPVLKWSALFFLRVHSPGKTALDQEVEHGQKVLKFTGDEHLGYGNFE